MLVIAISSKETSRFMFLSMPWVMSHHPLLESSPQRLTRRNGWANMNVKRFLCPAATVDPRQIWRSSRSVQRVIPCTLIGKTDDEPAVAAPSAAFDGAPRSRPFRPCGRGLSRDPIDAERQH